MWTLVVWMVFRWTPGSGMDLMWTRESQRAVGLPTAGMDPARRFPQLGWAMVGVSFKHVGSTWVFGCTRRLSTAWKGPVLRVAEPMVCFSLPAEVRVPQDTSF